ncbi:helix-turn-helix domain-containing protein [Pseudogemmobacter faecipullorum]|uniref:Helix-turn-helix domain-containing protein n=1 Tax=Pseudogemmobacter faecipullorum TaxID=2755041 RepID=A0ABS8CQ29_9RHOB|nr:helix-turn-helix domain-containing protein [Pseudogemmobacter faecipullorum]MCB5411499.1 hypothetical protein [Pseudogemmobacter faecipullorum]
MSAPATPRSFWTDAEMLRALALRDSGLSCGQIADRLGRSRNSLAGVLHRIDHELAQSEVA